MTNQYETPPVDILIESDWEFRYQPPVTYGHQWRAVYPSMRTCTQHVADAQFRRPVLAATLELAGYRADVLANIGQLEHDPAYGYVRVGATRLITDELWTRDWSHLPWKWHLHILAIVGESIKPDAFPVRRKLVLTAVQQRWTACSHKREANALKCAVCAAFGRLTTA